MIRLDKFLADMNVGTRAQVKQYIKKCQITVNDEIEKNPSRKIAERTDKVFYCGNQINYVKYKYFMFHKPAGCVSATKDNLHKTVMDYFKNEPIKKLFPVGRLDIDTEGLLLITNDGDFSHQLLSPTKHVKKTYYAYIHGHVTKEHIEQFHIGLDIGEKKPTMPSELIIIDYDKKGNTKIEVTIEEGKFHQVKRMFEVFDLHVLYLKRIKMGELILDENLKLGEYRELTEEEYYLLTKNPIKKN